MSKNIECPNCKTVNVDASYCIKCGKELPDPSKIVVTTTNNITGFEITKYMDIIAGTDIYLVGGVFGGGLANQENLFTFALDTATNNLKNKALKLGADAVVGVQTNVTSPGGINYIIVTLTGTAVMLEKSEGGE